MTQLVEVGNANLIYFGKYSSL